MHIMNVRSGSIINTDFVSEFFLSDTSDCTLLSFRWQGSDKPSTLERYGNRKEALDALDKLFYAISEHDVTWYTPESSYYFEERVKRDARTKRKGGS